MITVFGSINMDLIARVARLPKPGETVEGDRFSTAAGGKGANQALAARRAGSPVKMVGAVGNDAFSRPALALLNEAGVDLSGVKTAPVATGTAMILVGEDGENMIAVISGANGEVKVEDAAHALNGMKPGDMLMLQLEISARMVEEALMGARNAGVTSMVNIAPFTDQAARLASLANILVANETEFGLLIGKASMGVVEREEAMRRRHAENGQTLIVTRGAEGVVAIEDGRLVKVAGLDIQPVDTVGAGDTFCGYLASSLDLGLGFERALRRSAVAGSLACLTHGAQPSIPLAADVDRYL